MYVGVSVLRIVKGMVVFIPGKIFSERNANLELSLFRISLSAKTNKQKHIPVDRLVHTHMFITVSYL